MNPQQLCTILDEVLAGRAPPDGADPVSQKLHAVHDALVAERQAADRRREDIDEINRILLGLAQMNFDLPPRRPAGDVQTDAVFAGLTMLSEELLHAQTTMLADRDRAVAANRSKSAFLANMSHELRTPLNAILGYAELLAEELPGDASAQQDLGRVVRSGRHLLALVDAVLDLSQIEAGVQAYHLDDVSVTTVVGEVEIVIAPLVHRGHNHLDIDVRTTTPVRADPLRLRQILVNLLANAMKFTEGGHVELRVEEVDASVVFSIRDTGVGIAADQLEGIFEPFVQAHDGPGSLRGGSGLGLAIAREHARAMKGEIDVVSEVARGSVFRLHLPATQNARV